MQPEADQDDTPRTPETLEELEEQRKRRVQQALLDLNGPGTAPEVTVNQAPASRTGRKTSL